MRTRTFRVQVVRFWLRKVDFFSAQNSLISVKDNSRQSRMVPRSISSRHLFKSCTVAGHSAAAIFCFFALLACAHSPSSNPSSDSSLSSKLTMASDELEVYLGRPQPQKVSQQSVGLLSSCLSKASRPAAFMLKVSGSEFQVVEGELQNVQEIVACLNSQKGFQWSSLEGHWIWTSDFKVPQVVGKNWLRVVPVPLEIQQKSGSSK